MTIRLAVRSLARWAIRLVPTIVVDTLALLLLSWILPGFDVGGFGTALVLAVVIAVLTATLRPLLVWVALRWIVLSGGLLSLVISALVILLAAGLVKGVEMNDPWTALGVVIGMGLVTGLVGALLPFDDELSYFAGVARRVGRRHPGAGAGAAPGLVLFEIDGLAAPVLERALAAGLVPTMARWIEEGSHVLTPWECDLSSQTGASQAGILHGDNTDMPAFRWYEKDTGRIVVSNHPEDAAEIERRRPAGLGALRDGGSAVGNMLSGEAEQSILVVSRIADSYRTRVPAIQAFFADPQTYVRMLYLSVHDLWLELWAARRQRRRDERPRVARGGTYPLIRAFTTVVLRELGVYMLIAEMYRGVPAMYATLVGYDEVAHHSGPERPDTLQVLRRLDKQLARIERAAAGAPRPYRVVVLSDHGQSPGTPFRQLHGETLEELVGRLAGGAVGASGGMGDEGVAAVNVALTETIADEGAHARATRKGLGRRVRDGRVEVAADPEPPAAADDDDDGAAPIVLVSGCLGLVSFPAIEGRATLERVEEAHPGLVAGLTAHPGISWVMARRADGVPVVLGGEGVRSLADDSVEGRDPLADFGPGAADHLRRTDGFATCPDLLVNGRYDPATGEVSAFEEFAGSHGGLGGDQMHPFLLAPADLPAPAEGVVGAAAVNALIHEWRARLDGEGAPGGG